MVRPRESKLWKRTNKLFGRPKEKWETVDELVYGLEDYHRAPSDYISEKRNQAVKEVSNTTTRIIYSITGYVKIVKLNLMT